MPEFSDSTERQMQLSMMTNLQQGNENLHSRYRTSTLFNIIVVSCSRPNTGHTNIKPKKEEALDFSLVSKSAHAHFLFFFERTAWYITNVIVNIIDTNCVFVSRNYDLCK